MGSKQIKQNSSPHSMPNWSFLDKSLHLSVLGGGGVGVDLKHAYHPLQIHHMFFDRLIN